jgi:hypothetical protein
LLPLSGSALAGGGPPPKAPLAQKAWKPKWLSMKAPSENTHLVNTQAQRMFTPLTAVRITNHLRDEGSEAKEILVGGFEGNAASLKLYQEGNDRYTRVTIPNEFLTQKFNNQDQAILMQGMGTAGKKVVLAGGAAGTNGYQPANKLYMLDAQSKRVTALPDLKEARTAPLVGSSPNGRYIVVAGGYRYQQRGPEMIKSVEIVDRVSKQHVDMAEEFPGLVDGMPEGRFAGSIAWVQEPGVNRIFFIGGTNQVGQTNQPFEQRPTSTVDFYDVNTQKWGKMELPTPRIGPAVAVRHLGDGRQEIVVAGGGTGTNMVRPVDPQVYAVERIDPKNLTVKFGENLPEQTGLYTYTNHGDRGTAMEWAPNAMVITNGKESGKRISLGARFFGFANAYKTDPDLRTHEAHGGNTVVNINETTVNETNVSVEQTRVHQEVNVER